MKPIVLFICMLAVAACSVENKNEQTLPAQKESARQVGVADTVRYLSCLDSLEVARLSKMVRPEHELNTLMARNDTVTIVLGNRALFFPLGKFPSMSALAAKYSIGFTHRVGQDGQDPGIVTDNMQRGANTVGFVRMDEDKEAYEDKVVFIVSGKIVDDSLPLVNGTTIGMDKRAFLAQYFLSTPRLLMQGGKVIELVSALDGIKHYYNFSNEKLKSIEFTSDYVLD